MLSMLCKPCEHAACIENEMFRLTASPWRGVCFTVERWMHNKSGLCLPFPAAIMLPGCCTAHLHNAGVEELCCHLQAANGTATPAAIASPAAAAEPAADKAAEAAEPVVKVTASDDATGGDTVEVRTAVACTVKHWLYVHVQICQAMWAQS